MISTAATRGFATSGYKRAKAIRVKKSESRRVVTKAPKAATNALTEVPTSLPPFVHSEQQTTPQTFGGIMKESFLWGLGMAVAFSFVGIIFSRMEEESTMPNKFQESFVVSANGQNPHEDQSKQLFVDK
ncbi:unnamed protein product [Peronospora belbahrii]|uniref:Mitochondrial import inner membrane translocase subunit Tim21 n=1 Tax=Peronospora belbahrii TaxID=622444 RepID=A0AAU9L710_9STRA|nr:unnamed protein product [Peronospora belbahrii]